MKNAGEGRYISRSFPNMISPSYHHKTVVIYYSVARREWFGAMVLSTCPITNDGDTGTENEQ